MFAINIFRCEKRPKIHLVLQAISPQNSSEKCVECRVFASHQTVNITIHQNFTTTKFCAISHTQMLRFSVHQRATNDTKMFSYTHRYISPLHIRSAFAHIGYIVEKNTFLFDKIIIINNGNNRKDMYV